MIQNFRNTNFNQAEARSFPALSPRVPFVWLRNDWLLSLDAAAMLEPSRYSG